MGGLRQFLAYNNAVPVAISVMLLGAGSVFAATNPEAIYDKTQTIVSVDNTFIVSTDLDGFTPVLQIGAVTEDEEHYYIAYELETIDVVDGAWQGAVKKGTLTVAKGILGEYRDLGLYATEQFKQLIDHEITYLKEVQQIERKAITPKMVATAYSGLVGLFLDDSTETLPGYVPVVTPPAPAPGEGEVRESEDGEDGTSEAPTIQILGESPLFIALGSSYTDLGAVAQDDRDAQPEIRLYVDDSPVAKVTLDTSVAKNWFIRYEARDSDGNTNSVERIVVVGDPHAPIPTESDPGSSGGSETPTEAPEETPAPSDSASTTPEAPTEEPAKETPEETPVEVPPAETPSAEETKAETAAETPTEAESAPEPSPEPAPAPEPEAASEPAPEPQSEAAVTP